MRQVNRDELIHIIQDAMRGWTKSLHSQMQHHDSDTKLMGRMVAAGIIADRLQRLEILSDAPPPAPFHYPGIGVEGYARDEKIVPGVSPFEKVGEGSKRP